MRTNTLAMAIMTTTTKHCSYLQVKNFNKLYLLTSQTKSGHVLIRELYEVISRLIKTTMLVHCTVIDQ